MSTLLIHLAGPMQSWGVSSRFDNRGTGLEPSRSGVIGMIASALGMLRSDDIDTVHRLSSLRMGVRVDRQGTILRDYQTIQYRDQDTGQIQGTAQSRRLYLADADFTVGLEHLDRELLLALAGVLARPTRILSLGRRSCLPGWPIVADVEHSVVDLSLDAALLGAPDSRDRSLPARSCRFVVEIEDIDDTPLLGIPDTLETKYDRPSGVAYDPLNRSTGHARKVGIYRRFVGPKQEML